MISVFNCMMIWRNYIQGPDLVYPYSTYEYKGKGTFEIDNAAVAQIISQTEKTCKVEITTSRKGSFNLICTAEDGTIYTLPVTIGSFTGGGNEKTVGVVSQ